MAAYVGEGVGVRGGHPVLEVGVPVIPFLEQPRGAQAEFAERSRAVLAASHQAAVVEAFVIFDGYHEGPGAGFPPDGHCVAVFKRQRLHTQHVLIVGQSGHHHFVMKLVGHGYHHHLPRWQRGDGVAVELRPGRAVAIGPRAERLSGERAQQCFGPG
jgi:hypothetical protein